MTDEMIEAVTRAICKDFREHLCCQNDTLHATNCFSGIYDRAARAAIAAHKDALAKAGMGIRPREATEEMRAGGRDAVHMAWEAKDARITARAVWQAMWDKYPDKPDG